MHPGTRPHRRRALRMSAIAAAAIVVLFVLSAPWSFQRMQQQHAISLQQGGSLGLSPIGERGRSFNEQGLSKVFRLPHNTLAERRFVEKIDEEHHFLATPSVLVLPSGRILVLFEKQPSWGVANPSCRFKHVYASDDGGKSWEQVGTPGPLQWPQIFSCPSGVYIIGCERLFSANNNIVITRMLDGSEGASWSNPVRLTTGLSVITINTGVDVSAGRVTKAFEMIPSLGEPRTTSQLAAPVRINITMGAEKLSWRNPPVVTVVVQDAAGFIPHTLVKILYGDAGKALFFRVLEVDEKAASVRLRMERYTLFWQEEDVGLVAGHELTVGSNANVYGGVDWVSRAMNANETADLTDPQAWTLSNPLGNPASLYPAEVRTLFDASFRADYVVQKSILGFDHQYLKDHPAETAFEAGFGSLYWMEGVVFRLQDRRGSNGKLLNLLRVNNDLFCDLAALVVLDDSQPGTLSAKFLRYKNVPGLAVGHPAVVYDNVTDLYWMASNVNRDSTRRWKQPRQAADPGGTEPLLHITPHSKCEVDRSTMGLYYSGNGFDWHSAGMIDYFMSFGRHFTYPHMTVSGEDLLIVMRATSESGQLEATANYYNNHNSNSISFHRVERFRQLANVEWATFEGDYSVRPRTMSGDGREG